MSVSEVLRKTVWPRQGVKGYLGHVALLPLSMLFGLGVGLRNTAFRIGLLRSRSAAVPVVSVGNLTVGGTGKTPFTLWLATALSGRGLRVAILLRGYGGKKGGVTVVSRGQGPEVSAAEAGDEAVMLAKSFPGSVITAARRIDGAAEAVKLGCDLIVLDDGFQHRALERIFDIVLVDGRPGGLLPGGPMREHLSALQRADAVVLVENQGGEVKLPRAARGKAVFRMHFEPASLIEVVSGQWVERPLGLLAGKQVVAVSGIGQPERFYDLLGHWEAEITEVFEFDDHHTYTHADWQNIIRRSQWSDLVVTTEKDLVKLEAYPFATGKLVALRIQPRIDQADHLIDSILTRISSQQVSSSQPTMPVDC